MNRLTADALDPQLATQLRTLAEEAARLGGGIARDFFQRDFAVRLKEDRSEVSEADETAQAAIVALLRARRPDDGILAEEDLDFAAGTAPLPPSNERPCWVIDPIDGTRNFVRRIPMYGCSVGVMLHGDAVAGAVYFPAQDRLWSASQAEGLYVDGRPFVAPAARLAGLDGESPRMLVAIPSRPGTESFPLVDRWLREYVCRNLGSTALHLALVATGEMDGMYSDNPRLWDVAGGQALVAAAGGVLVSPDGTPLFPIDVATYQREKLPVVACARDAMGRITF